MRVEYLRAAVGLGRLPGCCPEVAVCVMVSVFVCVRGSVCPCAMLHLRREGYCAIVV